MISLALDASQRGLGGCDLGLDATGSWSRGKGGSFGVEVKMLETCPKRQNNPRTRTRQPIPPRYPPPLDLREDTKTGYIHGQSTQDIDWVPELRRYRKPLNGAGAPLQASRSKGAPVRFPFAFSVRFPFLSRFPFPSLSVAVLGGACREAYIIGRGPPDGDAEATSEPRPRSQSSV